MDWIATALALATVYLLGKKQKVGWVVGALADVAWMTFGITHGFWSIVLLDLVFLFLRYRGWKNWTKEKQE